MTEAMKACECGEPFDSKRPYHVEAKRWICPECGRSNDLPGPTQQSPEIDFNRLQRSPMNPPKESREESAAPEAEKAVDPNETCYANTQSGWPVDRAAQEGRYCNCPPDDHTRACNERTEEMADDWIESQRKPAPPIQQGSEEPIDWVAMDDKAHTWAGAEADGSLTRATAISLARAYLALKSRLAKAEAEKSELREKRGSLWLELEKRLRETEAERDALRAELASLKEAADLAIVSWRTDGYEGVSVQMDALEEKLRKERAK